MKRSDKKEVNINVLNDKSMSDSVIFFNFDGSECLIGLSSIDKLLKSQDNNNLTNNLKINK